MNQWRKDIASWKCGGTLYLSVPFTWLISKAKILAESHKGRVIAGGPAVKLMGAPWADETPDECPFDVLSFHNPCATFTTRGCPNRCPYCAVPRIEGDFRELNDWNPAPIVCDNNLLAASRKHFQRVIESLRPFPACDFNQGLDARLFTPWHAGRIARLKNPTVRFALDHVNHTGSLTDAVNTAKRAGLKKFAVYVLIGFKDTPEDAKQRLEYVRGLGIWPNPMRFQPLDAVEKDSFVEEGWTDYELRKMMHYYSRLRYLDHIPYDDYQYTQQYISTGKAHARFFNE